MRRMITSKKEIQLIDTTEEIFETGVWVIPSGSLVKIKVLKDLVAGYQYKIYLNVKGSASSLGRLETELGITTDYISFVDTKYINFPIAFSTDGVNTFRCIIAKKTVSTMQFDLRFDDTPTGEISFRYLLTRSKVYW